MALRKDDLISINEKGFYQTALQKCMPYLNKAARNENCLSFHTTKYSVHLILYNHILKGSYECIAIMT